MEDKMKRKADKLTKQSFALLDRIKQRKQKQVVQASNENNFIQDLYLSVFGKCSPFFNKSETAKEIEVHHKQKLKAIQNLKSENQELNAQCKDMRLQIARLKESKDEVGRMKTLNQEINLLEEKLRGLNQQIKEQRKAKSQYFQINQQLSKENNGLKSNNQQLQQLVEKLSKQLQAYLNQQHHGAPETNNANGQLEQTKKQLRSLQIQVEALGKQRDKASMIIKALQNQIQAQKSNKNEVKNQMRSIQITLQKTIKQKNNLQTELNISQSLNRQKITNFKFQQTQLIRNVQNLKRQLEMIRQQNSNSKLFIKQTSNVQMQIGILQNELQNAKRQLYIEKKRNAQLVDDKQKMLKQLENEKKDHNSQVTVFKNKISEILQRAEKSQGLNTENLQKVNEQKQQYQLTIKEISNKNSQLTEQLNQVKLELQNLKSQLSNMKQKGFEQQTLINALRTELNSTLHSSEDLKKHKIQIQRSSETYLKQIKQKEAEIKNLTSLISQKNSQIQTIKSNLQKQKENYSQLYSRCKKSESELVQAENDKQRLVNNWLKQKDDFQMKIQEITERMKFFKSSNDQINSEKIDLINSVELLAQQTKNMGQEIDKLNDKLTISERERSQFMKGKEELQKRQMIMVQQNNKNQEQLTLLKKQIQLLNLQISNSNIEQEMLLQTPDKVQHTESNKTEKHIETIKQLNDELTEAYKSINQLSSKLKQMEKASKIQKSTIKSPEGKDRSRSIKKLAGIFGFK